MEEIFSIHSISHKKKKNKTKINKSFSLTQSISKIPTKINCHSFHKDKIIERMNIDLTVNISLKWKKNFSQKKK